MSDLQTEQSHVDDEVSHLVTGNISKPKRIKTEQTAPRILRILENFTSDNIQKLLIRSFYNCLLFCSS